MKLRSIKFKDRPINFHQLWERIEWLNEHGMPPIEGDKYVFPKSMSRPWYSHRPYYSPRPTLDSVI